MTLPGKNYVFCLDLVLYWPIKRFDKERKKIVVIVIYEYKETESINSVSRTLKSYPLWVTLYIYDIDKSACRS